MYDTADENHNNFEDDSKSSKSSGTKNNLVIRRLDELLLDDFNKRQASNKDYEWFHGPLSRTDSEAVLRQEGMSNGLFLVRERASHPGMLVLSVCCDGKFSHYQIEKIGDAFFTINNSPVIHGIEKVVDHYKVENRGLAHKLTSFCRNAAPPPALRRYGPTNILHQAVHEGNGAIVKEILNDPLCPDVNAKDSRGSTVLHDSSYQGDEVIAAMLLRKGANANMRDSSGYTPLHRACSGDFPNLIKLLIRGGASPLEIRHLNAMQPIHEAAMLGHIKCIQALLTVQAPAWPQDQEKMTPYQTALRYKHKNCAKLLFKYKAPPARTMQLDWLHGDLTRKQSAKVLTDAGFKDGMFLVRNSSRQLDWFVLALVHQNEVHHYEIRLHEGNMYHLDDGPMMESIEHLIEFYSMWGEGLPCRLQYAIAKNGIMRELNLSKPFPFPENLLYYPNELTSGGGSNASPSANQSTVLPPDSGYSNHHSSANVQSLPSADQSFVLPPGASSNHQSPSAFRKNSSPPRQTPTKIETIQKSNNQMIPKTKQPSASPTSPIRGNPGVRRKQDSTDFARSSSPAVPSRANTPSPVPHDLFYRAIPKSPETPPASPKLPRKPVAIVYSESTKRKNRPVQFMKDKPVVDEENRTEEVNKVAPPLPSKSPPTSPIKKDGSTIDIAVDEQPLKDTTFKPRLITKSELKLIRELGQGEFGSVYEAKWRPKDKNLPKRLVAVKTLHPEHMNNGIDAFLWEAKVMMSLRHLCIVEMFDLMEQNGIIMIVQELICNGSMLDYLLDYPEAIEVKTDLYLWAAQIAAGMMYLEEKKFIHRDLAARNILLASKDQVKISDFGLSRAAGAGSDYYQASKGGRWPIKWYAPECVNYGTFSHASDVWSYGITLWEMFSFGQQPYENLQGAEVIRMLDKGVRLNRPEQCPEKVYEIMNKCWAYKPPERPTFNELNIIFTSDPEYAGIYDRVPGN